MQTETDILIVGGGIAGLSAALTAARAGADTQLLTGAALGGHLISIESIEGFPGADAPLPGFDLCPILQGQAAQAGAGFAMAEATAVRAEGDRWHVSSAAGDYLCRAVIVATGTRFRSLGIPGEAQHRGHGVSQCASCDAPLLGGQPVVVVGGGDSAAQEALVLAEQAGSVLMLVRGSALRAQRSFVERLEQNPRIEVRYGVEVTEILGDEAVTGVRIQHAGGTQEVPAHGVFVFIGLQPEPGCFAAVVAVDAAGAIATDGTLASSAAGIFAAGTVRAGSAARAAAAAGEGMQAALAAVRYLAQ